MTPRMRMNQMQMNRFKTRMLQLLTVAACLICMMAPAWAQQQDTSSSGQSGSGQSGSAQPSAQQSGTAPSSADQSGADQTNGAPPAATAPGSGPDIENPPLSGLDQPTSEPAYGGRSYLVPGIQLSESVNAITSGPSSTTSGINT